MMGFFELLLFIIISVGITNLMINSTVFENPRDFAKRAHYLLGELFSCMMCLGFWVGFLIGLISFQINPFYAGAIASVFSYTYGMLMDYLNILIVYGAQEDEGDEDE